MLYAVSFIYDFWCGPIVIISYLINYLFIYCITGLTILCKRLFNLDENTPFGNYQMNTDSDGNFTILKDFYISIQHWDLLLHFLRYGFTLSYYEGMKNIFLQNRNLEMSFRNQRSKQTFKKSIELK